jgi:hypothetical protein
VAWGVHPVTDMRRRSNFHGLEASTLASVLTGGAFCMFAVTVLWLAGTNEEAENSSARQARLQSSALADDQGSVPVDLPEQEDTPRVAPAPPPPVEAASPPLDRELAAGEDEGDELARDLLIPPPPAERGSTPARAEAVSDAGAPAPEIEAPPQPEPVPEERDEAPQAAEPEPPLTLEPCGMDVCGPGLVCCNASCGTCVAPGQTCSQLSCSMTAYPLSAFCGRNTCSIDEVCCNLSCGICAAPGESCSQRVCD